MKKIVIVSINKMFFQIGEWVMAMCYAQNCFGKVDSWKY